MKTNTRKTTRILCASTIAAMTILGSVAPALTAVSAEGTAEGTRVNLGVTGNTISFDKKIYAETGENSPNATVTYKIESRTPGDTEKTSLNDSGFDNVEAGPVALTASDSTFSTGMNKTESAAGDYYKATSTINADALVDQTSKPTVYTYTITESAPSYLSAKGGKTTRKLQVYVGYADAAAQENGTLSVIGSVLYDGETKVEGFENNYDTQAIHLTKKVTGNQGDQTKKFTFNVTLSNQYSVVTSNKTVKSGSLTPDENGNVTFAVELSHNETVNLTGLSKGAQYTVSEESEGYTPSATVDTADKTMAALGTKASISDDADTIVVTNNKEGAIPTGIYLNHKLPFNILGVALAGGAVALIAKKRHEALEDEDDE